MFVLFCIPAVLSLLVLAAHFLRDGVPLLTLLCLGLPFLLIVRRNWPVRLVEGVLLLAALEWVRTTVVLVQDRVADGLPCQRMVYILVSVAAFNVLAVVLLEIGRRFRGVRRAPAAVAPA